MRARWSEPGDRQALVALAERWGNVFVSEAWTGLFGDLARTLVLQDDGERPIGGLVVRDERRFGLRVCRNLPATPSCGPFLELSASNPSVLQTRVKQAMAAFREALDAEGYALITLSIDRRWRDLQPFVWARYGVTPTYTYLLDLAADENAIWERMSGDRRKAIRKATKDGVTVEDVSDPARVLELVRRTFERQERGFDQAAVARVLQGFLAPGRGYARVAVQDGHDVAAVFCLVDGATAIYLLGGYDAAHRHAGAGALAMWEAIRHARATGLGTFDFEGSSVPAIEQYFRGFGGTLTDGARVTRAWLPIEVALKLLRRGPG